MCSIAIQVYNEYAQAYVVKSSATTDLCIPTRFFLLAFLHALQAHCFEEPKIIVCKILPKKYIQIFHYRFKYSSTGQSRTCWIRIEIDRIYAASTRSTRLFWFSLIGDYSLSLPSQVTRVTHNRNNYIKKYISVIQTHSNETAAA